METLETTQGFYCDTDSLTTDTGKSPIHNQKCLGMFDLEKTWKEFRARAPKTYAGLTYCKNKLCASFNGYKSLVRAKGIPSYISKDLYEQLMNNNVIETENFTKILKYRESIRRKAVDSQNLYFGGYTTTKKILNPKLKDTR